MILHIHNDGRICRIEQTPDVANNKQCEKKGDCANKEENAWAELSKINTFSHRTTTGEL